MRKCEIKNTRCGKSVCCFFCHKRHVCDNPCDGYDTKEAAVKKCIAMGKEYKSQYDLRC